jgi:hypothetical protein
MADLPGCANIWFAGKPERQEIAMTWAYSPATANRFRAQGIIG